MNGEAEKFISLLESSGLRGRGGAGFPTGKKWRSLFENPCETKYVVANAAEGEPGTFKDRYLIRYNPYGFLEGLWTANRVIGAKEIYIAIKGSFREEITRLKTALKDLRLAGFFQKVPVHITPGPEEYLFGEEKALLNVIEEEGPFPRPVTEPPYEVGLFATPKCGNPALVNNVQTYAHVATLVRFGSESFRKLGTKNTPGTLLITLSGAIRLPGVYEVEAGVRIRDLLMNFGGGPLRGRKISAVLPGVSTGIIPARKFNTRADFDSLKNIGSGLASAGFIVLDNATPIPLVAQAVARFLYVESCTQCFACKIGLGRASETLDNLLQGVIKSKDPLEEIQLGAKSAPQGNRCYLPVQGAELIPSILKYFPREFNRLIKKSPSYREKWLIPKIVDFNSKKRKFTYDDQQPLKQPDWTYRKKSNSGASFASS